MKYTSQYWERLAFLSVDYTFKFLYILLSLFKNFFSLFYVLLSSTPSSFTILAVLDKAEVKLFELWLNNFYNI